MDGSLFLSRYVRIWMAKTASSFFTGLSRFVKAIMVAVLIPIAIGLLQGILSQLEMVSSSGQTFRAWMSWGFVTYVGIHVLLYRPGTLFRASHKLFSWLAVWLFGGHVASVDAKSVGEEKGGKGGKPKSGSSGDAAQGSTLVAFSPYVIPSYAILVSAASLLLRRWTDRVFIDGPVSFLIGLLMAFHWLMTADDLQQQRKRWHVETYLLAIGLVFVLTLLVAGACLSWAIPEFSFAEALASGWARTQAIYSTLIHHLFF